ncbi:MAG: hypothetical protein DI536_12920 [Archangium gephyra]|uniref:Uncharacterized protein n=1 Tax=Archangium gephyra TaxID=48 RepID=A0A2W5TH64_9BACT|nr:MAG: hypothetical protein DI536_12920 [Archangium gephyra]
MLAAVVWMTGCVRNEQEAQLDQAQEGMNALVDAIMSQDAERLRAVLSKEQIATVERRASSHGETFETTVLLEYEVQRRGLILNFGEDWLAKNKLEVSSVQRMVDNTYSVTISFGGDPAYGKPVYFSREGNDFKFAGITPELGSAHYAATGAVFWWNHWKFNNFGNPPLGGWDWGDFFCADNADENNLPLSIYYVGRIYRAGAMEPVNCHSYEYWYGAKKTVGRIEVPFPTGSVSMKMHGWCMYNAIGSDLMLRADGNWQCTPP